MGVGSSLPETAAGIGILPGLEGIFGVFNTSSRYGFGLHSFGVPTCDCDSSDNSRASEVFETEAESSAVGGVGRRILLGRAPII